MTSNYHTPPADGAEAKMSVIRAPLGELDLAITNQAAAISALDTRVDNLEADMPVPSGNPTEYLDGDGNWTVPAGTGAGVDGHVIQDEGVDMPQRAKLNFVGAGVTVTNEVGGTQVDIPGGGHAIEDEGTPITQRSTLNFTGAGVTVTDDAGKTKVEIPGGVTDHGALTGLGDDDHPQYHNDARGDARYPRKHIGKTAAPTASDDSSAGYALDDRWLDETNDKEYVAVDVSVGAAVWKETTVTGADLANAEGMLKNGKIVRTVSSNNLTVAIKTLTGSDPSASDPVKVVIDGTERSITSALSVTINAGTSTFKAGSAQHSNQILYLLVHLGWRAAASEVFIGVARCFGFSYADFSSTATNEDYLAYSGSAPASTDKIVNIGSVTATNSGSASYNWSVPATDRVINYPIFETPWMIWNPGWGGFSSIPTNDFAPYKITRDSVRFFVISNTAGTSNSTAFTLELPFRAKTITNAIWYGVLGCTDNGTNLTNPSRIYILSGATQGNIVLAFGSSSFTASGNKRVLTMPIMEYQI